MNKLAIIRSRRAKPVPAVAALAMSPNMSQRDWFAGMALAGIASNFAGAKQKANETNPEAHARWADAAADAMMRRRGQ